MSWSKLAPIAKSTGRPMASAGIVVNKDGVPKISLFLAASIIEEFGDPERVDISAGEGEHAGSILVEFDAKGAFELKNGVGGCKRTFFPLPAGCPDKPATVEACALGERAKKSVVIALPMAKWADAIAMRMARPVAVEARTPPPGRFRLGAEAQRRRPRHGRVPEGQGRQDRAAGWRPLPDERRDHRQRDRAAGGQRTPQGRRPRPARPQPSALRAA